MTAYRSITRWHEIDAGHRVYGHESKCANLHGHRYRIELACTAPTLDRIGRIIDFGVIKARLCEWLDIHWDHRMILWERDPIAPMIKVMDPSVITVPFNPTAENIAEFLVEVVGPLCLEGTDVTLSAVKVHETDKCSAFYAIDPERQP
jgi:6-pyruvoyltetrahydropterin/6-carboxytetrahydropterin synthase